MFTLLLVVLAIPGWLLAQPIAVTGPDRAVLVESDGYVITWNAGAATTVNISAIGTRTPLGGQSRGDFDIPIATGLPAAQGALPWSVPFIDSISFEIQIKGYDSSGNQVTETRRVYGFRPAALRGKMADGIYLDLHERTHQRLYIERNHRIVKAYLSTSSAAYYWLPRNVHTTDPHDHAGVFHVLGKEPMHWSRLFDVEMPWAMRYLGGHFIHATSPDKYPLLGTPASSGCNRMTLEDARELYATTSVGTRVEIIGPQG